MAGGILINNHINSYFLDTRHQPTPYSNGCIKVFFYSYYFLPELHSSGSFSFDNKLKLRYYEEIP